MYNNNSLDIIREVINIGMGEAANALSKLVNTRVIIKVPDIRIVDIGNINDYIAKEMQSLGIYISQNFNNELKGKTILFYTKECSISLLNAVYGNTMKTSSLSESGIATLNEIGNILMVSCMTEISSVIKGKIVFALPEVTVDTSENYFRNMLKELSELDKAIVVKNVMRIKDTDIHGYIFVLLSFEKFNMVIDKLLNK